MADIAALALREAIIPLQTTFTTDDLTTVKVEHQWVETTNQVPRDKSAKMYLPTCDDPSKKELFFYVIDQFLDAMSAERLHLTTGNDRYTKFRAILNGSLRLSWQTISANQNSKTTANFFVDLHVFIDTYFAPTARDDQLEYLRSIIKPYNMSVEALAARLRVVSRLGRLLPGSWDAATATHTPLYTSETQYKRALFSMMPMSWRIKFAETSNRLDDAAYTYADLTRYMSLQEAIEKCARGVKRARQQTTSGGGRGRGRGSGRGRGRGYSGYPGRGYGGGRGYGRGHAPSYAYYGGSATPPSNNRFISGATGGRYGNNSGRGFASPGRAGFQSSRGGRTVTNSPRRPMVQGRGAPPSFPQFMTDEHYFQGQVQYPQEQDQYYDQYYQETGYDDQEGDMYYAGETHFHPENPDAQFTHYTDGAYIPQDSTSHEDHTQDNSQDNSPAEDAHFLQDFGY